MLHNRDCFASSIDAQQRRRLLDTSCALCLSGLRSTAQPWDLWTAQRPTSSPTQAGLACVQGKASAPSSPLSPLNPNAAEFTPAAARPNSAEALPAAVAAAMEGVTVVLKPAADHAPVEQVWRQSNVSCRML